MTRKLLRWGKIGQLRFVQGAAGVLVALCLMGAKRHEAPPVPNPQSAATAGVLGATATSAPGASGAPEATAGATGATGSTGVTTITQVAKPSPTTGVAKATAAADALDQQIAKLPPLTGTGIDVAKSSAAILAHLNAMLRFYRVSMSPVQKVGEPSDMLYAEQDQAQAIQIAEVAFAAARNEAALLSKIPEQGGKGSPGPKTAAATPESGSSEAQRLIQVQSAAQARLAALQAQQANIAQQLADARGAQRTALEQQQQQVQGGVQLQQAMVDALTRISSFSQAQVSTGLAGDIQRLQRSAPELLSTGSKTPTPTAVQSIANAQNAGVTSQAEVLFQLLGTLRTLDDQIGDIDELTKQAESLRTPFVTVLRNTIQQGQALTGQAMQGNAGSNARGAPNTAQQLQTLTSIFQVLANATLPLSQEIVLLDSARGTLATWRAAVSVEEHSVLRDLLIRVFFIAVALAILAIASRIWARATVKYVGDLRRRRQLLFVRRAVIGFLSGLVLLFGFVTQFSSLATFAGFISAGIAVGLQSILLSVAAYFFIVGRYGVRVGDRITVAGVTGDAVEVGLVRFYMMELVGTGTEFHATGRVAVFANSVLFQTGTPLYKQMPGTEYAWHELTAKLTATADVPAITSAILKAVNKVYTDYKDRIEGQHQQVETWMGTALPAPEVESRLELVDGGLQFAVLFPVQINNASATDQHIAEDLVQAMKDEPLKSGLSQLPVIKAAVKS